MKALKQTVKQVLGTSAGWRMTAPLRRRPCLVLAYHRIGRPGDRFHHVDVGQFQEQMRWLRRHCDVIGPNELRASAGRRNGRPRVLVTFDDGYRDYKELAYPVLKELRIPAVNFLSTRYVDDGALFWWDLVTLAVDACARPSVTLPWTGNEVFDLATAAGRRALSKACRHRIANGRDADRDRTVHEFCAAIGVDAASLHAPRQVMTWDEIRETMDLTHYGGHTHSHVRVSRVDDAQLDDEIGTCSARMQAELGAAPTLFAYPIGDSSTAAKALLPRHGFEIAFSIIEGYAEGDVDWLDVRRYPGPRTVPELAWLATGWAAAR